MMIPPTSTVPSGQLVSSCFVYGTLLSREVVAGLIDRCPDMVPAFLRNHRRHPVSQVVYPGMISNDMTNDPLVSTECDGVRGMLFSGIRPDELRIFDWFEDEGNDYRRVRVDVLVQKNSQHAGTEITPSEQIRFKNGDFSVDDNTWEEISTEAYLWARPIPDLDTTSPWNYESFRRDHLDWYLRNTVRACRAELDRLGMGK